MTITPYGQLGAAEIARSDQSLAKLAERANTLGKLIAIPIYATPGDVCGIRGCDLEAELVIAALYGLPERLDVPMCKGHYDNGVALEPILMMAVEIRGLDVEGGVNFIEVRP